MHKYRKKTLLMLNSLLTTFFIIFFFGYVQMRREKAILDIGLSFYIEDMLIMVLSFIAMLMVVYEIHKVEHPHEYEKRMKRK